MTSAPDSPFELTGTLLDIVNYVSSLDMDGIFPVADGRDRSGRLLFENRCLRNAWLEGLSGEPALRVLAGFEQIRCSLDVQDGESDGPLDYSYQRLRDWVTALPPVEAEEVAETAEAESSVEVVASTVDQPEQAQDAVAEPAVFPRVRSELFRQDHDVLLFGAMMDERVQCQTVGIPGLQVQILAPLIKALQAQVEGMQNLARLVPAKNEYAGICVQAMEFPSYLVGLAYDERTPWQIFVISKKSVVLNHTVMLARLDQLWKDMQSQVDDGEQS